MAVNAPVWVGQSLTTVVEQPGSPAFTFGQKTTCRRVFRAPFSVCFANRTYRGALASIPIPDVYVLIDGEPHQVTCNLVVSECTVTRLKGGEGELTISYEGWLDGQVLPSSELAVEQNQVDIAIEKHPRYAETFAGETGASLVKMIDALLHAKNPDEEAAILESGDWIVEAAEYWTNPLVQEVYELRRRGVHQYACWPPTISITDYFAEIPGDMTSGGYIEDPPAGAQAPTDLVYLRAGDRLAWDGSKFTRTRSWIGAPDWEEKLYG